MNLLLKTQAIYFRATRSSPNRSDIFIGTTTINDTQ